MPEMNATNESLQPQQRLQEWSQTVSLILSKTALTLGYELSAIQIACYQETLRDLTEPEVDNACWRWLRESPHMPKPADILRLCGKGPDEMAANAWAELLAWLGEWGVDGVKIGEPTVSIVMENGYEVAKRTISNQLAPLLPARTTRAIIALTGTHSASMQRIKAAIDDPERLARVQSEFVKAWKGAL